MKRLLVILAALFMAGPAFALGSWQECGGGLAKGTNPNVGEGACVEFAYTVADAAVAAVIFRVNTNFAVLKFDPDTVKASSDTSVVAEIMPQTCLRGYTSGVNVCSNLLASNLDGTEGAAASQKSDLRIPRGVYRIELSVDISGAETAVIQIHGEN